MERHNLDYRRYWQKSEFEDKRLTQAYWVDPRPDVQGMLTSEYIRFYDRAVNHMIFPFEDELLKPAAYELTLGWRCMVERRDRLLSDQRPWLEIPPNSIAFVSMQQVLRLPHYIVARFDLIIDLIYEGLLLGTGPQVDPGFQGALGCPLHNISNDPIHIKLGAPVAKIDFVKTAPPLRAQRRAKWLREVKDEDDLEREITRKDRPAYLADVKLFKHGERRWREPIYGYIRGKRPQSSVAPIRRQLEQLRRFGVLGLISLVLTAGTFIVLYVQAKTDDLPTFKDLDEERQQTNEQLERLRLEIDRLRQQISTRRRGG